MCQRYYPIPFDILKVGAPNMLVVLDELGATNLSATTFAVSMNAPPPPPPPPPACGKLPAAVNATMEPCLDPQTRLTITAGTGAGSVIALATTPSMCLTNTPGVASWMACAHGNKEQQWFLPTGTIPGAIKPIAPKTTSHSVCLDVFGQDRDPGALVDVWPCNGGSNQRWSLGPAGRIKSNFVNEGLCLGLPCLP